MKRLVYLISALSALFCCACGKNDNPGPSPVPPADESLWRMHNDPVEKVDVYCGDILLETYTFEYNDKYDMVTSITRTDKTTGSDILKVSCTYSGTCDASFSIQAGGASTTVKASFNEDRDVLEYGPDTDAAFRYRTRLDSYNALPITDEAAYSYMCQNYSSSLAAKQIFAEKDGDISSVEWNPYIQTTAFPYITVAEAKSGLTYAYTYSEAEDLQNFAAFLMPCDFPLWFATELPGCKHLITGMTMKSGNVTLPESFTVSYTFNDGGSIKTALRTDYSRGRKILERTYKYTYL